MSHHLAARRRAIRANGRPMVLRREAAPRTGTEAAEVALLGFPRAFRPDELSGGVSQGDEQIEVLADEMAAADAPSLAIEGGGSLATEDGDAIGLPAVAAFPGAPRRLDRVTFDDRTVTVQGVTPRYHGRLLLGWSLWVRG